MPVTKKRTAGRPKKQTDTRELLIKCARDLFVAQPYDKVSTRQIADNAGVNIAMIRYYFGNKEGLFETMIRETVQPMQQKMKQIASSDNNQNLFDFMRLYYQEMKKVPQFPGLISQVMHMPASQTQRRLLEKVFVDMMKPDDELLFSQFGELGSLREGVDPTLCKVSFIALMVFPFIAPPAMLQLHGVSIDDDFLEQLLEHNVRLLTYGLFTQPDGKEKEQQ